MEGARPTLLRRLVGSWRRNIIPPYGSDWGEAGGYSLAGMNDGAFKLERSLRYLCIIFLS